MPFITEELWGSRAARRAMLIVTDWPRVEAFPQRPDSASEINWLIGLVSEIRSVRTEMRVDAGAKIPLVAIGAPDLVRKRIENYGPLIERLARLSAISLVAAAPRASAQIIHDGAAYALPLEGVIDLNAEKLRLAKEIEKCVKDIAGVDAKFANAQFVERAPPEILDENRQRRIDWEARRAKLAAALEGLSVPG
jgi:valyl-tRNA synthetase